MKQGEFARTGNVQRAANYDRPRGKVACLDCFRARLAGRPWGCLVHVAEGVL